jgi:hypothetical protein
MCDDYPICLTEDALIFTDRANAEPPPQIDLTSFSNMNDEAEEDRKISTPHDEVAQHNAANAESNITMNILGSHPDPDSQMKLGLNASGIAAPELKKRKSKRSVLNMDIASKKKISVGGKIKDQARNREATDVTVLKAS